MGVITESKLTGLPPRLRTVLEAMDDALDAVDPDQAGDITFTATGGLSSTNVQDAIAELDTEKASKAQLTDSSTGTVVTTFAAGVGRSTIIVPLSSLATGLSTAAIDLLTNFTVGYKFKLLAFDFVTTVAGTGSSASQTFNLEIGTTNVTGGSLVVTLSSTDTIGKVTAGTAITAANTGAANATISIEMAASGTVFTAGGGYFVITIQNMDTADAVSGLAALLDIS